MKGDMKNSDEGVSKQRMGGVQSGFVHWGVGGRALSLTQIVAG